jgi:hypothetical protein
MESTVLNDVLGLLNIHDVKIFNNSFGNCRANWGGGLSLLYSLNAIVHTIIFENCSSLQDGGAVIFQEIYNLDFFTLTFLNCYSGTEVGAIKAEAIRQKASSYNILTSNSSSQIKGVFMLIRDCEKFNLTNVNINNSNFDVGGGIYIENSNCTFINISSLSTFAISGGFLVFQGYLPIFLWRKSIYQ